MSKKLFISLIFSNLVVLKTLSSNHRMYNLYTKFVKILDIYILHNSTSPLVDMYSLVPAYSKGSAVRETYQ